MSEFLDFAERHGLALLEVHAGQKRPFGDDWQNRSSKDRATWNSWLSSGANVGVHAGASDIATIDIEAGRWDIAAEWFRNELGIEIADPHVSSARGGFHIFFRLPDSFKRSKLKFPWGDLIVGNSQTVAPPSCFDGKLYRFFSKTTEIYDGAVLLKLWPAREPRKEGAHKPGRWDFESARALYNWLSEHEALQTYGDWVLAGMVAEAEFGSRGLELWEIVCRDEAPLAKWGSFSSAKAANPVALGSLTDLAHKAGWKGTVHPARMFDGVAAPTTERRSLRNRLVNAASLAGKPVPERQWLVPGWIPMEQVTLLYGDGAVGKSLAALQLCTSAGALWFGLPVKQGPAMFITAEDSDGELHRRLVDIERETKRPLANMGHLNLSSFADEDAIMAALNGAGQLVKTTFYDEVVAIVQETKPVLLVLDTLADIYGGNEVVRAQARAFINMLRKIAIAHNLAVVVLAHPSLDGMRSGTGTSGSTGWSNSVRSRLYLDRVHDADGSEPDTNARVLRSMKMNYGSVGNEIRMRWQKGVFVTEGVATSGDPIVTAAKAERVFLELLDRTNGHSVRVSASPNANNYAPKVFTKDALKQGVKKRDLVDAMARLMDRGKIENAPYGAPSRDNHRLQRVWASTVVAPPLVPLTPEIVS
jgi:hypothetical protein